VSVQLVHIRRANLYWATSTAGFPDFTFTRGSAASALPIRRLQALSLAFMQSLREVDFAWQELLEEEVELNKEKVPPSITFHADSPTEDILQGRTRVELNIFQ
jgi:hypothetical protein